MKLRECPFCGGEAVFVSTCEVPDETPRGYFRCENMCCEQCYVGDKDEAAEAWNRRFSDDLMERMEDDGNN